MRRGTLLLREEVGQRHLAVPDLDDEDARLRLAALLAGGAVLLEPDRAVDAHEAHAPEGVADRRGLVTTASRRSSRRSASPAVTSPRPATRIASTIVAM